MKTIRDVLDTKGREVLTIAAEKTVFEALEVMAENEIGALVVIAAGELAGVISERDYARGVVLKGRVSRDTSVKEVMTTHVVCVRPDQSVEECMGLMSDKRTRHLPVLDDQGRLAGIVSIGDLVAAVISDQRFVIDQLEHYIAG